MDEDSLDGITAQSSNLPFQNFVKSQHDELQNNQAETSQFLATDDLKLKCSKTIFLDGKFYKVNFEKSTEKSMVANCNYCQKEIRGALNASSNFTTHLKRVIIFL